MSDTTSNTPAKKPLIHVSLGVIYRIVDDQIQIFMQIRDEEGPLFGKWEFPGGNIEKGENPAQAIVREVEEEVGIQTKIEDIYFFKTYQIETQIIDTEHRSKLESWFDIEGKFENIPDANYEIIDNLREFFQNADNFRSLVPLIWKKS